MIAEALSRMLPRAMAPGPTDDFWYYPTGQVASSGINVRPDNAMAVAAVYACVCLLGETLGSLPFRVYKMTGGMKRGRTLAEGFWLDDLLYERPNSWQTACEFVNMIVIHVLMRGNFYARRIQGIEGMELKPLDPDRVTPEQTTRGPIRYIYREPPGGKPVTLYNTEVFHVRGLTLDGITGLSVLDYAKNSVGLAIAQETHGASQFRNGGIPPVWISRPKDAPPWNKGDAKKNFRSSWRKMVGGPENAGNPPILEDGMQLMALQVNNENLQWIESQGFSGAQICRFFRVAPWMIGLADPPTDTEQASLQFTKFTLRPWAVRLESAADAQLVDEDGYYTKITLDEIERASLLTRYEASNIGVQGGWKTRNECRLEEDLDPLDGLDEPLEALNMQPAGGGPDWNEQGGQPGKGKPVKRPPAEEDDEEDDSQAQRRRAAFSVLLDDAAARIAAAEVHGLSLRAGKASQDRGKWEAWATTFYQGHAEYIVKVLRPVSASWLWETSSEVDIRGIAEQMCKAGMIALHAAESVASELERWSKDRAEQTAEILKGAFFA